MTASATAMIQAADTGDINEVKILLAKGASINEGDYDNRTPLHLAVSGGHIGLVNFML